ncbi:hypothetical protein Rxycam_00170 [Rubrobacter xylanophilus DSM 9941]|uniref:BON domain-containing protein n=1 Tax=Rubrobacter xylanophilus TaxID=49319 RepID=UPI001C63E1A7|nr:BON domain-containing protein [Rubrobacter xylanophilus]QYJ14374.1 hypothetical protein Rxycam_00170 [Rubrobacter xylanophilus DSM 9941]
MAAKRKGARLGARIGARVAPKAGKVAAKSAWRLGKAEAKLARRALSSQEPRSSRYAKYGLFTLLGVGIGALLGRFRGGGSPVEGWGGSEAPSPAEQARSEPSAGPLVGEERRPESGAGTGQQEEVEQRIRSQIGTDPRTATMARLNVEVNDGVAELRGEAPSEEARRAAGEIASRTEGVREVRNLLTVNPEGPRRERQSGEPDRPS